MRSEVYNKSQKCSQGSKEEEEEDKNVNKALKKKKKTSPLQASRVVCNVYNKTFLQRSGQLDSL